MKIRKDSIPNKHAFYLWQTETYGKDYYLPDLPTDIYEYRPMPRTPAGNLVSKHDSFMEAFKEFLKL